MLPKYQSNWSIILLFCLGACSSSTHERVADDRSPRGKVHLQIHAAVPDDAAAARCLVRAAGTLRGGDRFYLKVWAEEPVYVYAARLAPSGTPEVFYPTGAQRQVSKGVSMHIPEGAALLQLDGTPGLEEVRVLASHAPLEPTVVSREIGRESDLWPREPPPIIKEKQRDPCTVSAGLDEQGMARLRFPFRHE